MAWVIVPGSNSIWEFENTADISNTYSDSADGANVTISGGIRTFTFADGNVQEIYIRCRKAGQTTERGELSKTYYDAQ